MKVNAINCQLYPKRNYEKQQIKQNTPQQLPQVKNEIAFKGWAGKLIGFSVGSAAALLLAPVTGGLSILGAYFAGGVLGGVAGDKIEGDD